MGPSFSAFGAAWPELMVPALDSSHLGLSLLLQSSACLGSAALAPDLLKPGAALSTHGFARVELVMPVLGKVRLEVLLFALDLTGLGALVALRSPGCSGLLMPAPDPLHPDAFLLARSVGRSGPATSAMMRVRMGSSLLALDPAHPGSTPSAHSFASSGPPMLLKSFSCMGTAFLLCGIGCFAPSLSAPDCAHPDLMTSVRSFSKVEFMMLVPDLLQTGFLLLPRSHTYMEPALPTFGMIRTGSMLLALDLGIPGSLLFARSPTQLGSAMPALDFLHLGPTSPARGSSRPGLLSSTPERARSELALLILDLVHPGFASLPHSLGCLGAAAPVSQCARPGLPFPASDFVLLEFLVLVRSPT